MSDNVFIDDFSAAKVSVLLAAKGWQARYKELLLWSKLVHLKPEIRHQDNRVQGCSLDTWLVHKRSGEGHYFAVDSDSRVVKGLAVLLLLHIDGRSTAQVQALDIELLMQDLDLHKHLSPSRNNGFKALLDKALLLISGSD